MHIGNLTKNIHLLDVTYPKDPILYPNNLKRCYESKTKINKKQSDNKGK